MTDPITETWRALTEAREHLDAVEWELDQARLNLAPLENRVKTARLAVRRLAADYEQATARRGSHRPLVVRNRRARIRAMTAAGITLRYAVMADQHAHPEAWRDR